MEENKYIEQEESSIDYAAIFAALKKHKRLYIKVLAITFVLGCIYMLSKPNYYNCEVKLAPELNMSRSMNSLSAMALSLGMRMGTATMGNTEAIYPMIYPELISGTDFRVSLFDVPVHKKDSTRVITYYDYLLNNQKTSWVSSVINAPFRLIGMLFSKEPQVEKPFDPFCLTKTEDAVAKSMDKRIICDVDKNTMIITINVIDQDPYIAACMADTVQQRLQDFITEYRTKKARVDLEFTRKLCEEAKARYEKARRLYAEYSDANQDIIYNTARIKLQDLENDMQLKYNAYNTLATSLQGAEAKVQQETPSFTNLQTATVPVKKAGPARAKSVLIFLFLAFLCTSVWVLHKEGQLKQLLGMG